MVEHKDNYRILNYCIMQEPQEIVLLNHYQDDQSKEQENIIYIHTDKEEETYPDTFVDYLDKILQDLCVFIGGKKKTNVNLSSSLEKAAEEFNKIER